MRPSSRIRSRVASAVCGRGGDPGRHVVGDAVAAGSAALEIVQDIRQARRAADGCRLAQDRDRAPVASQQRTEADRSEPAHARQDRPGIALLGARPRVAATASDGRGRSGLVAAPRSTRRRSARSPPRRAPQTTSAAASRMSADRNQAASSRCVSSTATLPARSAIVRATRSRRSVPRPLARSRSASGDDPSLGPEIEPARVAQGTTGEPAVQRGARTGQCDGPCRGDPCPDDRRSLPDRAHAPTPAVRRGASRSTGRSGLATARRCAAGSAPGRATDSVHGLSELPANPHGHGFIAATSWNRAGKIVARPTRETATRPSSSGWRSASRTSRPNSGQLVEEEDALVCAGDLARRHVRATADHARRTRSCDGAIGRAAADGARRSGPRRRPRRRRSPRAQPHRRAAAGAPRSSAPGASCPSPAAR